METVEALKESIRKEKPVLRHVDMNNIGIWKVAIPFDGP